MPQSLPLAPQGATSPNPPGLKGPRADVVMELKRTAGATAKALAGQLGLSLNAVRHHLKELELAGLVAYAREHRGVGAPAFVYRLSVAGEALFPRRYELAVASLLDHVVAREGRAAAVAVLEARYRELTAHLRSALTDAAPEERVAAVARVLADEGYMPEVLPGVAPGMQLVEHNCPIQRVAERFPEVCEAEARFLADVLEAEVTRGAHIASGCGTCEYQIQSRVARRESRDPGPAPAGLATTYAPRLARRDS